MTEVYFPADHSPAEWRSMAVAQRRREVESWERSDTDGFLSQWASGLYGRLYDRCAEIAECGGIEEREWLFDSASGQPIEDWRWVEGRYGASILIPGRGFFRPSDARKGALRLARDRAKGFHFGVVRCEVVVRMGGGGGGCLSVQPITERKRGAKLEVVAEVSPHYTDRD